MKLKVTIQEEEKAFYGHGKLLITGEYFVLDGARALAVPTKFGQRMRVKELHATSGLLYWVALNNKKQAWLNLVFDTKDFTCLNAKQDEAHRLTKILTETRKLNPEFLTACKDMAVETLLEFPNEWGLGTSSTLIHCVSKWAGVDGYQLLKNTLGGSGYDVACAENDSAILYQLQSGLPSTTPIEWEPVFKNSIYFAYTGVKKISSEAIKYYREQLRDKTQVIESLNQITDSILKSTTVVEFEKLITEHETLVGSHLKIQPIKDTMFAGYWGSVKSLGAWGGDFVLMTNEKSEEELKNYLAEKNMNTVFSWGNLILSHK